LTQRDCIKCSLLEVVSKLLSCAVFSVHSIGFSSNIQRTWASLICRKTLTGLDAFSARIVHELKTAPAPGRITLQNSPERDWICIQIPRARLYAEKDRGLLPALFSSSPYRTSTQRTFGDSIKEVSLPFPFCLRSHPVFSVSLPLFSFSSKNLRIIYPGPNVWQACTCILRKGSLLS